MKQRIRAIYIKRRKNMDKSEALRKSIAILDQILKSEYYKACSSIYTYVSHDNEVDTRMLMKHAWADGKCVYVPKVESKGIMAFYRIKGMEELHAGKYGILEPIGSVAHIPTQNDMLIMPGVVFDYNRNRIGYGGGYYDRFLSSLVAKPISIALCYEYQVVEALDVDAHDMRPDNIVTELGWIN